MTCKLRELCAYHFDFAVGMNAYKTSYAYLIYADQATYQCKYADKPRFLDTMYAD